MPKETVMPAKGRRPEITRETKYEDLYENLTIDEAADYIGVSYATVYNMVHAGEIPSWRLGKMYRIPKTHFDPSQARARTREEQVRIVAKDILEQVKKRVSGETAAQL
jgi:excisionase family DNA binding protein